MKSKEHIKTLLIILVLVLSMRIQIQSVSTRTTFDQQEIVTNQTELIVPLITESTVVIDGTISDTEYGASFTESDSGIIVYWEHDGTDLSVGLVSPGTGWVAFGIGAIGVGNFMQDSNMILGGLNGSSPYCYDLIGLTGHALENDTDNGGEYNVNSYAVTEVTTTILEVQIPMESEDLLDPVLEEGLESIFFFAYHPDEDTMSIAFHESGTRSTRTISALIESEDLDLDDFDKSIPLVMDSGVTIDGQIANGEYFTTFIDDLSGIQVYWEHDMSVFTIGLVAPGTGWISLGIGPSMQDSTMYMGGIENGDTYCVDLDGLENWLHEDDGTNDIIDCVASETDDQTTLEFTIPMNPTDSLDTVLEVKKVYSMFLAYHRTSDDRTLIHTAHSAVFTVLVKPEVQNVEIFMDFKSETEIEFNQTINFEVVLTNDSNKNLTDIPVIFFMESQFGEIIVATIFTDSDGKAKANYTNQYLSHNHTFGARSLETIIVVSGEVFAFLSSEFKQEITFKSKIVDDDRERNVRLMRYGLLTSFWVVGIIIWGGFSYTFYQMFLIFKGRNEEFEENISSQRDVNLDGGNE
ncbi:MAG: hypothetical protein HeimC2_35960 [Candidatus Heimdallarchaeota archaeon LC_2]|nr:MAG: hypothetical protein HeimC2_35960 [Candidatus Heimdallarchaeota archaeon LC_2]